MQGVPHTGQWQAVQCAIACPPANVSQIQAVGECMCARKESAARREEVTSIQVGRGVRACVRADRDEIHFSLFFLLRKIGGEGQTTATDG